jgi:predicted YcjX-like family ATPase
VFEIAGAASCDDIIKNPGGTVPALQGQRLAAERRKPLGACSLPRHRLDAALRVHVRARPRWSRPTRWPRPAAAS